MQNRLREKEKNIRNIFKNEERKRKKEERERDGKIDR
jgi:hypothetical protein